MASANEMLKFNQAIVQSAFQLSNVAESNRSELKQID